MRVFDFGSNWQVFSEQRIDAQRLDTAMQSLRSLLARDTLQGSSVLDVGCGSGLFSIAAQQLGATKVVGVDVNPRCIAVSKQNVARLVPGAAVVFQEASALSSTSMESLGQFDLVYAWGSLHHTGAMWNAIRNVSRQVVPGGTFVLAIYNTHVTSSAWKAIKWFYNQLPSIGQRLMAIVFAGIIYLAKLLVTRRNPLEKERGMDFWYDVIDWIGGYPYEYATRQEIESFLRTQGFTPKRFIAAQVPTGCNEFVFERDDL
jgi:2-polyprenyl-3-methyl-5-hydroxy-6-metoxy-1,4-benzoquinol methylase